MKGLNNEQITDLLIDTNLRINKIQNVIKLILAEIEKLQKEKKVEK